MQMAPEQNPLSIVLHAAAGSCRQSPVFGLTHGTERNSVTQRKLAAHISPSDVSLTRPPATRQPRHRPSLVRAVLDHDNHRLALMDEIARLREGYVSTGS